MLLREEAAQAGVTKSPLWNSEHGTEPELIHIPAVLAFLGYSPWECPDAPVGKLTYFKKVNGLSFARLGGLMGRDPERLEDWWSGRRSPCTRNRSAIESFFRKTASKLFTPQ